MDVLVNHGLFVAVVDGQTVGSLRVVEDGNNRSRVVRGERVYIQNFSVHKSYRRRGYGRELLTFVLEWYQKQGILEVTLAVESRNEIARELYQKMEFERIRECKDARQNIKYDLMLHKYGKKVL
ncbi:MAG: GNAT family N-acetyltransferase [bacterium]|nr:GNAT family N-acetyltransferase [bacterium]